MEHKYLENGNFWGNGHRCTVKKTGESGLILDRRYKRVEDGTVMEYLIHVDERTDNQREWMDERELLVTGLTEPEESEWHWHFKGLGHTDDKISEILLRHGGTPVEDQHRAFYLLHGMTEDTAAEVEQTKRSIESAMRAGRMDCI